MNKNILFALIGLLSVTWGAPRVMGDWDAAEIIGGGIGQNIGQIATGVQQMQRSAEEASREIQAARRQYWQAVESGGNLEEAKSEFARQLRAKDFFYMWMAMLGGNDGEHFQLMQRVSPVDNGIRPTARPEFIRWVNQIRNHLGVSGDQVIVPGSQELDSERPSWARGVVFRSLDQIAEAIEASAPAHKAYIRERDWGEIDMSGITWPWDTDALAHAIMVMRRYSGLSSDQAAKSTAELKELFGEAEVLAAANRVRTARRNAEGYLADPAAIGVDSTRPDAAFAELLATTDGNTYFKYLLWQGGFGGLSREPKEAMRQYQRFVWCYGREAIEEAANEVLNLPKSPHGSVDIRTGNRASQLRLPHLPQAAVVELLQRGDPEGRIRAMFAFHPEAGSPEDISRLRRELEQRYGEQAVANATRALYAFWHLEDLSGPNHARRQAHRGAAREAAAIPERWHHFYETDHALLIRILKEGAVAVVGEHVPALTEAQRLEASLEQFATDWERQGFLLRHELQALEREILDDQKTYPHARRWLIPSPSSLLPPLLNPNLTFEEVDAFERRRYSRNVSRMARMIRTLQAHSDLQGDPQAAVARLTRAVETAAEGIWARVRSYQQAAQLEEWQVPPTGGASAPDMNLIYGTWSGTFGSAGIRHPVTIHLARPERPGGLIGTAQYFQSGRLHEVGIHFISRGFAGEGLDGGWGLYSLEWQRVGGTTPTLVTLHARDDGQLDVEWFTRGRVMARGHEPPHRVHMRARLQRGETGGVAEAVRQAEARRQEQDAQSSQRLEERLAQRRGPMEGRHGPRGSAQPPAPATALLRAEQSISYDGVRIQFRGSDDDVAELRTAAEAGNARACLLLGELSGQGQIEGGAGQAVKWFERGHELGDANATARLGLHLLMGRGVEENDPRRAERNIRHLAQTAANGNSALGMYLFAECIAKGIGAEANPDAARPFYQRAAAMGNPLAQRWCDQNGVSY
jgi:hypothetical protein